MAALGLAHPLGGGCILAAAAATLLTAGCGSPAAAAAPVVASQAPAAAAPADPPVPEMVMVTFTDRGYRASDVTIGLSRPAMLMLVDDGTRTHTLRASIPVTDLQVDDGLAPSQAIGGPASVIDVSVTAGQEADVTFTPAQAGRYALFIDGAPAGALVVTP